MTQDTVGGPSHDQQQQASAPVLLVGVDGGPGGQQALLAAGRMARRLGMTIVVAHVQPPFYGPASAFGVDIESDQRDLEIDVMTQAALVLDSVGVPWCLALAQGDPVIGLNQLAQTWDAAVIVIGAPSRSLHGCLARLFGRATSQRLARQERRPVLLIPSDTAVD